MAEPTLSARERLNSLFTEFLNRQTEFGHVLLSAFERYGWTAFAFGGTPRGVFVRGPSYAPRDFDLVFEDSDFEAFAEYFASSVTRRTRFGGLHLQIHGIDVDAWSLRNTWAFREGLVADVSFESLPQTTFFNVDAIVVSMQDGPGGRKIYDGGFEDALRLRLLDINLEQNPFPALCVVRAFHLAKSYRLNFSPNLVRYITSWMDALSDDEMLDAQLTHYGEVEFSRIQLSKLKNELRSHRVRLPHEPARLFPQSESVQGLDYHAQYEVAGARVAEI